MRARPILWLTSAVALFASTGCECTDIGYVPKEQYNQVVQQRDAVQNELTELKKHRYELHRDGFETWRLDTITGDVCLMLAPEETWKMKKFKDSPCPITMAGPWEAYGTDRKYRLKGGDPADPNSWERLK